MWRKSTTICYQMPLSDMTIGLINYLKENASRIVRTVAKVIFCALLSVFRDITVF